MKQAVADIEAIEKLVASQGPHYRTRLALSGLLFAVVTIFVPVIGIPFSFDGNSWQDVLQYWRAEPWSALGIPIGGGVILTLVMLSTTTRDVRRIARRVERDWRHLTDRFWIARVLLWGIAVGCGIGIPIGTLLALDARPHELPEVGGRLGVAVMFLLMTWAWTLPTAFLFRFLMLRSCRRFVRIIQ